MRAATVLLGLSLTACTGDPPSERTDVADAAPDSGTTAGTEYTASTSILNEDGSIAAAGWARGPVFVYDRELVPEDRRARIREWDFYAVHAPDFAAGFVLARIEIEDVGIVVLASVTLHDFATGEAQTRGGPLFGNPDIYQPGPTPDGVYEVSAPAGTLTYGRTATSRTIDLDFGDLTGHIELDDPVGDSVALVTPFAGEGQFFYENKVVAMTARGHLQLGETRYELPDGEPIGVMDWVRAVVPSQLDWTWATGHGVVGGRTIGLNLGSVFGDETQGTPNAVIVDGVLHKLDRVDWVYDVEDPETPWRMISADGRVDLVLEPTHDYLERIHVDLGFYTNDLWKPYGTWRGTVVLDDGTPLDITGLAGSAEFNSTTW